MRTTVDLDERVLERAKKAAAANGQTLSAVVSEALNAYLALPRAARVDQPFELLVRGRATDPFPSAEDFEEADLEDDRKRLGLAHVDAAP